MQRKKRLLVLTLLLVCIVSVMSVFVYSSFAHSSMVFLTYRQNSTPTPAQQASASSRVHQNSSSIGLKLQPLPIVTPTPKPKPTPRVTPIPTPPPIIPTPTPPSVVPTATPTPAPSSSEWTLLYSDDFTSSQLNSTWTPYMGKGGGTNTYDPNQIQIQNGVLQLGINRQSNGQMVTSGVGAYGIAQVYGKYVIRAKLPYGTGMDPYALLWPESSQPNMPQIDLFESINVNKDTLYVTIHGQDGSSSELQVNGDFASEFHTFTYEWTPSGLSFYVDGTYEGILTQSLPTIPMWLGIATDTGDAWEGNPSPSTVFPVSLDIDSVQIYKYNG
jgi:beta-glucanase (GH16 family)